MHVRSCDLPHQEFVRRYFLTGKFKMLHESDADDHFCPSIRLIQVERNGSNCGFHLTRGKWDPYPWVSSVDKNSAADIAGVRPGDCVLEVNGEDVIGQRVSEIAERVKSRTEQVSLLLWNAGVDLQCSPEALCCGPMPANLQRLSACMSTILAFLECPVCLETIQPPTYQCDNGHLICIRCRAKSERCPVCRIRFNRGRSLVSDQVYNALVDAFNLKEETQEIKAVKIQQIFKSRGKNKNVPNIKITHSNAAKFLTKLVNKSSSVDNLVDESKYLTPAVKENNFNLKNKSLSSNQIFNEESPVISRSSSISRLSRDDKSRCLSLNNENRPASYHGSFESLNRRLDSVGPAHNSLLILPSSFSKDNLNFYCPFDPNCTIIIEGSNIVEHFKINHQGPLIQYFTSSLRINLERLYETSGCFVISLDNLTFFFNFSFADNKRDLNDPCDMLMWMWYLGSKQSAKEWNMKVEVKDKTGSTLLSFGSIVFSLNSVTCEDIRRGRKGVFFSPKTLQAFSISDITLDIAIVKSGSE